MSFISEADRDALSIRRMIFHVVGKDLAEPILLPEIAPPQQPDFFLGRVKSALMGNRFMFRTGSTTEAALRAIAAGGDFTSGTQALARDFHTRHRKGTSNGVFFVFDLSIAAGATVYALIKYDHDEVVRYSLGGPGGAQPSLERIQETFVKKPEAMQKIALVRLHPVEGGEIMVRDRSKKVHISEYFEVFLNASRVNDPDHLCDKLVEALKGTYKQHRGEFSQDVQRGGVNRIYDVLRQGGHRFGPEDAEPLITAIFGQVAEDAPLRRTLERNLRDQGISEETFDVNPERVQKPRRRVLETEEGVQVLYDEGHRPRTVDMEDGRKRIEIVTARITRDDVDTEKHSRQR